MKRPTIPDTRFRYESEDRQVMPPEADGVAEDCDDKLHELEAQVLRLRMLVSELLLKNQQLRETIRFE